MFAIKRKRMCTPLNVLQWKYLCQNVMLSNEQSFKFGMFAKKHVTILDNSKKGFT